MLRRIGGRALSKQPQRPEPHERDCPANRGPIAARRLLGPRRGVMHLKVFPCLAAACRASITTHKNPVQCLFVKLTAPSKIRLHRRRRAFARPRVSGIGVRSSAADDLLGVVERLQARHRRCRRRQPGEPTKSSVHGAPATPHLRSVVPGVVAIYFRRRFAMDGAPLLGEP